MRVVAQPRSARVRRLGGEPAVALGRGQRAQVLADTPGATMIASQVEAILQDIDRYQLNEFDPELALRGITIALKACRSANGSVSKEKSEELLQRVARIDLVEFLKQGG